MDQVVTGNCKEMGCEDVHWIHVAHDQIRKWVLQTCYIAGDKIFMYFRMTQMGQDFCHKQRLVNTLRTGDADLRF